MVYGGLPVVHDFINDLWKFIKKNYEVKKGQEYWTEVINDANELMEQYNNDFLGGLVLTCIDDMEQRFARTEGRELEHSIVENVYSGIMDKRKKAGGKK